MLSHRQSTSEWIRRSGRTSGNESRAAHPSPWRVQQGEVALAKAPVPKIFRSSAVRQILWKKHIQSPMFDLSTDTASTLMLARLLPKGDALKAVHFDCCIDCDIWMSVEICLVQRQCLGIAHGSENV